jgi:hypothetical protein
LAKGNLWLTYKERLESNASTKVSCAIGVTLKWYLCQFTVPWASTCCGVQHDILSGLSYIQLKMDGLFLKVLKRIVVNEE